MCAKCFAPIGIRENRAADARLVSRSPQPLTITVSISWDDSFPKVVKQAKPATQGYLQAVLINHHNKFLFVSSTK